jgi:hypothetical protein
MRVKSITIPPLDDDAPLVECPPPRVVNGILLAVAKRTAVETSSGLVVLTTTA